METFLISVTIFLFFIYLDDAIRFSKLLPIDKIKSGLILWSKNYEYKNNRFKFWLQISPFLRYCENKKISYNKRLKHIEKYSNDTAQLNNDKWFCEDKTGKSDRDRIYNCYSFNLRNN